MQKVRSLHKNPFNPSVRRMERPTDSLGHLETTGKGVGVAVFDSGIHPHPDVDQNLTASVTTYSSRSQDSDKKGHGTATASVIAGTGQSSQGNVTGVAPGAKVINVQVLNDLKNDDMVEGYASFLGGIDWVIQNKDEFNIRVINISGGYSPIPKKDESGASYFIDPFGTAIQKALDAGIVVVAAAGNEGPEPGTVYRTPNHNPNVITVGALDTKGTHDDYSDDDIPSFSSRGTMQGDLKPDLVASGVGVLAALAPNSEASNDNQARMSRMKRLSKLGSKELVVFLDAERKARRLGSGAFIEQAPKILKLLPEKFQKFIGRKEPRAQAALGLATLAKLTIKDAIDTESEAFQDLVGELRHTLDYKMGPQPTMGFLPNGQAALQAFDGTSFSAPIVSGVIAHMFEVNPDLTPAQVKEILVSTARPMPDADPLAVGAGALDAKAAIKAARRLRRIS